MWGSVRVTNPALGAATDLLVQNGGTAILSETPEIYGAEHLLTRRAVSREVGDKLIPTCTEEHALAQSDVPITGRGPEWVSLRAGWYNATRTHAFGSSATVSRLLRCVRREP